MTKSLIALAIAVSTALPATATFSDSFTVPGPDANARIGALMPYTRYDSEVATLSGGAQLAVSTSLDATDLATQASDRSYVKLPTSGAGAEWTVSSSGDGVTMRFTMPDSSNGMGLNGSLDIYVNGVKDQTVELTSYFMYQYFSYYSGSPSDTPNGQIPAFGFDEVHFKLNHAVQPGDKIRVQSSGASGLAYGVDFIELEAIPSPIAKPEGAISVTDFGAVADDGRDDYAAFTKAMSEAARKGKNLYIPAGTFHLSKMWHVYGDGITVTGAGIWHTNLKFTNANQAGGGISGGSGNDLCDCRNMEICHIYINSNLRSRYNENAIYKCFMDVFMDGTVIHDVWEEHFECGFWLGDYHGSMEYSNKLKIVNCRIRNNLADGVNFCQGTSHAAVYNCSVRNCGDDGLAVWNNNAFNAVDEVGNVFAYNTIELVWRAGGIAIYGGNGHSIHNNYIRDMFMASGIHLNTTFPGYGFNNNQMITFDNNVLVGCGTDRDCWSEDLAAIDIKGSVKNIRFTNTQIYDSPVYAMRFMSGPHSVTFNNTRILGAGLAHKEVDYSCVRHSACAIRLQTDAVTFAGGVTIGNVAPDRIGNNSTWPIWTDNNRQLAQSVGHAYTNEAYTTPALPAPGSIDTSGIYNDEEPGHSGNDDPVVTDGFDLVVSDISFTPEQIVAGTHVVFKAQVTNIGNKPIAAGKVIGVQFQVDGRTAVITWCDTYSSGLEAGQSVWLTANGGTNGSNYWTAVNGDHTITAWVDDINRIPNEIDENNNMLTLPFSVPGSVGIEAIESVLAQPAMQLYDIQGRPVGPDYRGIVIRNGRKVLVK